jgi:hypothetical protein
MRPIVTRALFWKVDGFGANAELPEQPASSAIAEVAISA